MSFELIFWGTAILVMVPVIYNLNKKINIRAESAHNSLKNNGFVIDDVYLKPIGKMTRIWGKFNAPIPFYLQVSNIDPIGVAAGNLGIADNKVGDEVFDENFIIRTNKADLLNKVLTPEIRKKFMERENIRFRTGSIYSLLSPEYFKENKNDRSKRDIWMIEQGGILNTEEVNSLHELVNQLYKSIETLTSTWEGEFIVDTSFFEGR